MKPKSTTEIVFKTTAKTIPQPDTKPQDRDEYDPNRDSPSPNYLVYGTHEDAPPGFALRVGKKPWFF